MADKITNYPSAITMHGLDLLDKSNTNDEGVTYNQTESFTVDQLMTYINLNVTVNNLYNIDGTVTGKRNVTMNGFAINWINGNMRSRSILNNNGFYLEDSLQVEKAGYYYDVGLSSAVLELSNAGGTYFTAIDGNVGIGISTPTANLDVVGNIKAEVWEAKTQSGIATMGYEGHNLSNYGFLQTSAGGTALNSATGQNLDFRINNSVKYQIVSNELRGNSSLGMKFSMYNVGAGTDQHGIGFQAGLYQNIVSVNTVDFTWGFGTSGSLTRLMTLLGTGELGIGTTTPNVKSVLDLTSTTQGFLKPRMTTVQRDAILTPPAGLEVYNTTTNRMNFYNGSAWEVVTSA